MELPTVTAVIPWSNRPELEKTLAHNAAIFRQYGVHVLIVNCGGDPSYLRKLLSPLTLPLSVVALPDKTFNRSYALNVGAHYATAKYLFMLDADVLLQPETLPKCITSLGDAHFITIMRMRESSALASRVSPSRGHLQEVLKTHLLEFVWSDGSTTSVESTRIYLSDQSRGGQGQLLVTKSAFLCVDGYNSGLTGWGFEDLDIIIRLQRFLHLKHLRIDEVIHLSHSNDIRDGGNPQHSNARNFNVAINNYNEDAFMGTFLRDVESATAGSAVDVWHLPNGG
jgi:glycosyltransferase involved in cell wall biosynthesis